MAGNSFYGGRAGFSFIIVKSFSSVDEMVTNFKQGPEYTAVHYDEHILINTENKNNPDNGKIYRRGYDYTNSLGGAVYVGTIVGPTGPAPMLEITSIEEIKNKKELTEDYENRYTEGSYSIPADLVPGKDENGYNDKVEWACCCVRDENGSDSIAYIGFKFPYLVVDLTAESVSPYYNRSDDTENFTNELLFERTDDKQHPFYEKWKVSIPKGIKGDTFKNFRVMIADDTIQEYEGQEDDIENQREVLVYDYYNYDKNETDEPTSTIYLGDFNIIKDIIIDDNGTVTIKYSHDNDKIYNKRIKYIDKIYLNNSEEKEDRDYKFHIIYNTGEEEILDDPINYILETVIDKEKDYHLLVYYSSPLFRQSVIDSGKARIYDNRDGWLDLGSVKDDSGVLIGLNVPLSAAPNLSIITNAIDYLNSTYPQGLTNPKFYGKIVTIGSSNDNKTFYAFDYDKNTWYYLGEFKDTDAWTFVSTEDAENLDELKNKIAVGGIWFVVEGEDD